MHYVKSIILAATVLVATSLSANEDVDDFLVRGQYQQALILLEGNTDATSTLLAASAYLGLGQPARSLELLTRQPASTNTDMAVKRADLVARSLLALGQDVEAKSVLQGMLETLGESDPLGGPVHNNLGVLAASSGDKNLAKVHFENAIQLSEDPRVDIDAAINLARVTGELQKNTQAMVDSIRYDTVYGATRSLAIGQLLRQLEYPEDEALAWLDRAMDTARELDLPDIEARALSEISALYAGAGRHDEALVLAR
jgi:tetratricopeptide (TPR) repeat protein